MIHNLCHIVKNSARRFPKKEAFKCNTLSLTYAELDEKSNQLAKQLINEGVKKGDRVGIYMNRCIESAIAVYGILKSGAAYVPLDTTAPISRTLFLINDCDIEILVTTPLQKRRLRKLSREQVILKALIGSEIDSKLKSISWESVYNLSHDDYSEINLTGEDLAYIMYTSGSTGEPKGIMHTHNSALAYAQLSASLYELNENDRVCNHAPLHFDISTFGYYSAPLVAATTIIVSDAHTKLPASLSALLAQERITVWYSVPLALIQMLLSNTLESLEMESLRWVLFGGENFTIKHLKELMKIWPSSKFSNVYGPAEVNQCSYYNFDSNTKIKDYVPIGKIWGHTEFKILDKNDKEVIKGETGVLVVQSTTMMKGYWNNVSLTQKSLYSEQSIKNGTQTFYRTGDLVKEETTGNLIFLGRNDRQVKIRGYRIELDEIEAVLSNHRDIEEVSVCISSSNTLENQLIAVVRPMFDRTLSEEQLLSFCKNQLPSYSVPNKINIVSNFPRTSSGKIDLSKLKKQIATIYE